MIHSTVVFSSSSVYTPTKIDQNHLRSQNQFTLVSKLKTLEKFVLTFEKFYEICKISGIIVRYKCYI